jgi:type I restriction enzyme S subunit
MSNTNKKWEKVKLGDLFDLYAGGDVDRNNFSPIKTSTHLYPIYSNSLQNEGLYGYTSVPKYKGNSITITGRGFVGIPMYREQPFDAIIRLLVLTPKDEKQVNGKFVSYYISQYVDFPKENTGVPQLTIPKICDIELPIPSIDEQERIVNIIETKLKIIENANKVCSEQTFVIEKLFDSYLKKIVNTKKKYEMVKLDDLCKIERGGSPRPIEHYLTKDKDGINWIKIGDAKINSKYIDNTAEKIIKDGAKRSRNV